MLKNKREIQDVYHIIKKEIEKMEENPKLEDKQIAYELIRRIY